MVGGSPSIGFYSPDQDCKDLTVEQNFSLLEILFFVALQLDRGTKITLLGDLRGFCSAAGKVLYPTLITNLHRFGEVGGGGG